MAGPAIANLEALLAQLRALDLQSPSPELEQHLNAAAEAAKACIKKQKKTLFPAAGPAETRSLDSGK
jgi:hypothetical protein